MNIKLCKLEFETDIKIKEEDLKKIRGFIGRTFIEHTLLHNHEEDKLRYSYPLIQYKFVKNKFFILGINEGAETLMAISSKLTFFDLLDKKLSITKKNIELWEEEIKLETGFKIYQFETPYFAFNQKNYNLYKSLESEEEKKKLIDKILVGNILSFLKGLGIWVDKKIVADMFFERIEIVEFKEQKVLGLKGEFAFNGILPNYIGLGKSVSLGNGTIRKR